jgi:hypothetical protein
MGEDYSLHAKGSLFYTVKDSEGFQSSLKKFSRKLKCLITCDIILDSEIACSNIVFVE